MGVLSEQENGTSIKGFFNERNDNDTGEEQIFIIDDECAEIILGSLYDEILKAVQLVNDFGPREYLSSKNRGQRLSQKEDRERKKMKRFLIAQERNTMERHTKTHCKSLVLMLVQAAIFAPYP